jgi:hypothetical protein
MEIIAKCVIIKHGYFEDALSSVALMFGDI